MILQYYFMSGNVVLRNPASSAFVCVLVVFLLLKFDSRLELADVVKLLLLGRTHLWIKERRQRMLSFICIINYFFLFQKEC